MIDQMLEYHSYMSFLKTGDRAMSGTKIMGKRVEGNHTLINTPDIYVPAGGLGYHFSTAGTYLVICTWNLAVDQDCTFTTDFKINGTSVFDAGPVHKDSSYDPFDQTSQLLLEINKGDVLTIETTMSTGTGTLKQGSSIVIMKAKGAYGQVRYSADASAVSAGTEVYLGKASQGGTIEALTSDVVYGSSVGALTPGTGAGTSRPYFVLANSVLSGTGNRATVAHYIKIDGSTANGPSGGSGGVSPSVDPVEITYHIVKTIDHGDAVSLVIEDTTDVIDLTLNKGAALTLLDISNNGAIGDHSYACGLQRLFLTLDEDSSTVLFSDTAAGGGNVYEVVEESGIDYNDSDGTFTINKAGVDGGSADFYIMANIKSLTSGDEEGTKTLEVKNNGSVIWTGVYFVDQFFDNKFDMTVSFIANLKVGDVITFVYTNPDTGTGSTRTANGNTASIFRLSNLKDAKSHLFKGSRNLLREDGIFEGGPDALIQEDFDINTHKKQDQRFRVVDQAPTILGSSGPPSVRGRVKGTLPFRVSGPKGGKK